MSEFGKFLYNSNQNPLYLMLLSTFNLQELLFKLLFALNIECPSLRLCLLNRSPNQRKEEEEI